MAPKRPAQGGGSNTPKKAKVSAGQTSLHNFFPSPSRPDKLKGPSETVPRGNQAISSSSDEDWRLAQMIAKEDGVDLETAHCLETEWNKNTSQQIDAEGKGKEVAEIIDVDNIHSDSETRGTRRSNDIREPSVKSEEVLTIQLSSTSSVHKETRVPTIDAQLLSEVVFPALDVDPLVFSDHTLLPWMVSSYAFLANALTTLSKTRSRTLILNTLTNFFRLITLFHPQSLLPALYLLSNTLSPSYIPFELKLGPSIISKSIQQVSGLTPGALSRLYKTHGDPGDVAFAAKSSVRTLIPHPPLTIIGVYENLVKIAGAQGQGAAKTKQKLVEKLLLSAKGEETRYLVRTLFQNLRVGAVRTTILTALARAMSFYKPKTLFAPGSDCYISPELITGIQLLPEKESKRMTVIDPIRQQIVDKFSRAEAVVKHAFVVHPNFNDVAAGLLEVGLDGLLDRITLTVGIPIHPTLGSPMRSLEEIYERLGELPFSAELKYDGQRAQIHAVKEGNNVGVKIFSRHLEDMTDKYPDVIDSIQLLVSGLSDADDGIENFSFILDAEIVAVDSESGELRSFQDLSQRARKGVRLEDVKVAVGIFAYDLMYFNGKPLIELPFRKRRTLLRKHFPPLIPDKITTARFYHVESCDSENGLGAIESFWQRAISGRSEGLMIKVLDHGEVNETESSAKKSRKRPLPASYEPDKRTLAWLKLKKDYVTGVADSLDLVPVGAWHGNGRKSKWWSPILLALWDGFSDAFYKEMKERYSEDSENYSAIPMWNCNFGGYRPSVYFRPIEVWEVRGADITLSPISTASQGLIPGERGLSLRFPRFIKIREDKGPEEASSAEFLADLWRKQENRGVCGNRKEVDEGELLDADWDSEVVEEEVSEEES